MRSSIGKPAWVVMGRAGRGRHRCGSRQLGEQDEGRPRPGNHPDRTATVTTTPTATVIRTQQVKVPVPGPVRTVTKSVPQTYTTLSDGTYVVGTDIQPGVYKTCRPARRPRPARHKIP
jgi:hypothetical protein